MRYLTVSEAAAEGGVSEDTIRRRLAEGAIPGARRIGRGPRAPWRIPEAGFARSGVARTTVGDAGADMSSTKEDSMRVAELEAEVAALRAERDRQVEVIRALESAVRGLERALDMLDGEGPQEPDRGQGGDHG